MENMTMNNFDRIGNIRWIVIIFILLSFCSCSKKSTDSEQTTTTQTQKTSPIKDLPYVECNGTIQPGRRFIVRLGVGERISQLLVSQGQNVKKDTPLVILAHDDLQQQITTLEEMKSAIWKEEENLKLLSIEIRNEENNRKQLEDLVVEERHITEKVQGYQADAQIRQWQERLNQSEGQLRVLKEKQVIQEHLCADQEKRKARNEAVLADLIRRANKLKVLAPFDGTVKKCHEADETAAKVELVLELWDESSYMVNANLWQNQVYNIHPGNRAEIFPDFYQNTFLIGTVKSLSPADSIIEDGKFPKFPVSIEIKGNDNRLMVGMSVSCKIYSGKSTNEETKP
jgi:multidrug resistance efflux pump